VKNTWIHYAIVSIVTLLAAGIASSRQLATSSGSNNVQRDPVREPSVCGARDELLEIRVNASKTPRLRRRAEVRVYHATGGARARSCHYELRSTRLTPGFFPVPND
jgi:hypothetical protein